MRIDEQNVIGSVFLDNDSLHKIYNTLSPEMFQGYLDREIYRAMLILYDTGNAINMANVWSKIETLFDRDAVMQEFADCTKLVISSTEIESYAKIIIKEWQAREIKTLVDNSDLSVDGIDNSLGIIINRLTDLMSTKISTLKTFNEIVTENQGEYFNGQEKKRIKIGFYKLDDILGGLEGGDVTVIGARPAVGKSAFVTQIITQVASKSAKVGYFNLEMNMSQVYERMLSHKGQISLARIRRAKAFLDDEEEKFKKANEELKKLNIVVSAGTKKVSEIKTECRHQKFDLIVVDYLQLIKADREYGNRASEVGNISKSIKELAMELNVPVILLSQLRRVPNEKENHEPTMSELRESGDIEQDASQILMMWNLSDKKNDAKGISVVKNRMGVLGKVGFEFDGEHMTFTEAYADFDKFLKSVESMDKAPDFETPFD